MYTLEGKLTLVDKSKDGVAGDFVGVKVLCNGRVCCELNGGISTTVAATYAALESTKISNRTQDFLHGIVLAMSHCTITGEVPIARAG